MKWLGKKNTWIFSVTIMLAFYIDVFCIILLGFSWYWDFGGNQKCQEIKRIIYY